MAAEYYRVKKKKFSDIVRGKKFEKLRFALGTKEQICS